MKASKPVLLILGACLLAFSGAISCAGEGGDLSFPSERDAERPDDGHTADDDTDDEADDDAGQTSGGAEDIGRICDVTLPFSLEPGKKEVPFPNDFFTVPDASTRTGKRVSFPDQVTPLLDNVLKSLWFILYDINIQDGFSIFGRAYVPFNDPPDRSTLPPDFEQTTESSVFFLDLTEGTEEFGRVFPVAVYFDDRYGGLVAEPQTPWLEKHTYLGVVRDTLRAAGDRCIAPAADFRYLKRTTPNLCHPYPNEMEPERLRYQPIFEYLDSVEVPREDLLVTFTFTAQSVTDDLRDIGGYLQNLAATNPPQMENLEYTHPSGREHVDVIVRGTFESLDWRGSGGVFAKEAGTPEPAPAGGWVDLEFLMTLPKKETYSQPFPVVIYQHGSGSSKESMFSLSSVYAEQGIAAIGIDSTHFGSRGTGDASLDTFLFWNVLHLSAMRDNFRQTVADQMWLALLLKTLGDLDIVPFETGGDGVPDLDLETIFFHGHSLGALMGGINAAVCPTVDAYVVSATAGDFMTLCLENEIGLVARLLLETLDALLETETLETVYLALEIGITMMNAADPAAYARYVVLDPLTELGEKEYLLQYAIADSLTPSATEKLAFLMGIPLASPFVHHVPGLDVVDTPHDHNGVFQFPTDDHHFIFPYSPFGESSGTQLTHFIRSRVDTGTAEIINPFE